MFAQCIRLIWRWIRLGHSPITQMNRRSPAISMTLRSV